MNKHRYFACVAALLAIPSAAVLLAADTDYWSPRGAPHTDAGKTKTIDQVEPRTAIASLPYAITNAGSYYLTCSLSNTGMNHGISINADDVKLDLSGFALNGTTNSDLNVNCWSGIFISTSPQHCNIVIRNGVIRGWGWHGIEGTNASETTIENVKFYGNGMAAVVIGPNSMIENCSAYNNGRRTQPPFPPSGSGCIDGLRAGDYSTVRECKSRYNGGCGIYVSLGGRVTGCTAAENTLNGIYAESYSSIKDSLVMGNNQGGICVQSQCRVIDNTCGRKDSTMGTGIRVDGTGNRIENNTVAGSQYGIQVTSGGSSNLITCNSASGNMNNFYMANSNLNSFGTIVPMTGGSVSNSNPWSNFTF